ncbi:MAG: transporter substrate-binding domain-containing protein [Jiangellaceae bacterium]
MRKTTLLAALAAGAMLLTACGDDDGDATTAPENDDTPAADFGLVEEGTLSVCSDVPYSPFEVEDADAPSGYSGFDIDLMQAIADDLGLDLAVRDLGFDAIQSGAALGAGQCDVAASAMTITEEREENVNFADPYFDADQSLLVKGDSGYTALADLAGQSIGVQADTTGQAYAVENAPEGVEVVEFPDAAALFAALEAGSIVGILQDLPVNADRANQDDTVVIVETFPTGEQYGFATAEDSEPALLEAINSSLATLREDGTYDELYEQYFPSEG